MTKVQEATLPLILKGKDVLAKAKTGTGKTVAFLLPAIEVLCKLPRSNLGGRVPLINVLVICPTRELVNQVASEAKKLLEYHPPVGAQVVIGGTWLSSEQGNMQANPYQIFGNSELKMEVEVPIDTDICHRYFCHRFCHRYLFIFVTDMSFYCYVFFICNFIFYLHILVVASILLLCRCIDELCSYFSCDNRPIMGLFDILTLLLLPNHCEIIP